jgi:hypothetical protein
MITNRGNGYYEADYGVRDACLITHDYIVLARTSGDTVVAYTDACGERDKQEVREWADEYGYPIEWN